MSHLSYDLHGKPLDREGLNMKWISYQNYLDNVFLNFSKQPLFLNKTKSCYIVPRNNALQKYQFHDEDIENLAKRRLLSKKELNLKKQNALKQAKLERNKKISVENNQNFSDQKPEVNQEKNSESKPNTDTNKKQTFGLKFAVADFSQKIIDNEDMNIVNTEVESKKSTEITSNSILTSSYSQKYSNKILSPIDKFVRAIKTINLLLKATRTNVEQSKKRQKQYQTYTDEPEVTNINTKRNIPADLSFDVSYFKAKKEKTLSHEAINILKKHKSLRTSQQIHFVVLSLTDTVEAFSEFPKAMQKSLVENGWYERYSPKQVIIRQGHAAQNFYFIISGLTSVSIAKKNNATGESCEETVAYLKKGNSFGELALMYGGKRNASVTCINNVELLSVTREDFVEIFMNLATDTEPDHIKFLRQVSVLDGWPIDLLPYDDPKICLFTFFRRGTVLCRDSRNSEWIYILRSGTCRIIKGLAESFGKYYKLRYNPLKIEGIVHSAHKHKDDKKSKIVYVQMGVLNSKDVFGLQSVAFDLLGDYCSVTLVSDGAECVAINKRFFCEKMPELYLRKLRYEIQPYPEERTLIEKFQNYMDWHSFQKEYTTNFLTDRQQ